MATTTNTRARRAVPVPAEDARRRSRATTSSWLIRYIVLILMTIFFLGPFIMALFGSFKTHA